MTSTGPVDDRQLDRLRAGLVATPRVFGGWRRSRAAERLTKLGTPAAIAVLAERFAETSDPQLAELVRRALLAARDQKVIDAVAGAVMSTGDVRLATILDRTGRAPSDPGRQAVVAFLAGDFDGYADLDFDGSLLRGAYAGAGEELRRQLAEKARAAGRLEWVRVVTGGGDAGRRRLLSTTEWEAAADVLEGTQRWEELWHLALEAPAIWATRMLRAVADRQWRPAGEAERAAFTKLVRLASAAGAAKAPASTAFGDEEPRVIDTGGHLESLAVTPDGTLLITGGYLEAVRMWHIPSGLLVGTLPDATDVVSMTTTPDGNLLITGDVNGNIRLWHLPSGTPAGTYRHTGSRLNTVLGSKVLALALAPGAHLVASGGYGQYVQLWSRSSTVLIPTVAVRADLQWIPCLAVTPDGRMLISGGGRRGKGNLRLWGLPGGEPVRTLAGHTSHVSCLGITPDGTLLASGGYDNTVRLWRLPSGEPAGVLTGHTETVLSMAVTPDGKLLASGGFDNVVRLWHLPSGAVAGELAGHTSRVECLTVSPDGQLLASGAADGYVRWWTRRRSPLEKLVSTPVGQVSTAELRTVERSARELSADERAWLDLVAALVRWHHRHDVELADASSGTAATPWDVELGDGDGDGQRRARPKRRSKGERKR